MKDTPMQFPYGAVYFRKSNPPREHWERDYAQAAKDGFNVFRHWFMWGAIEVAPGEFDFSDYDEQLRLAEKYGMKTIIAEYSSCTPEWVAAKHPDLLMRNMDGSIDYPRMGVSCATGGFNNGLCLDKEQGWAMTRNFLEKLAAHYKGHPALLGYDVVNESCHYDGSCFCEDTDKAFQVWLKEKYKTLENLMQAWHKYSYTSFDEIRHPHTFGFYADSQDWFEFKEDSFFSYTQRKIDVIRSIDPDAMIAAHGVGGTFSWRERFGCNDWKSAPMMDLYGLTWIPARHGSEPYRQFSAVEMTRAASAETSQKKFWHAEMQGGPLWLQPQLNGRPREDARLGVAEDIRLWNLTSMACGAKGVLYLRWRPLLDGPLFGAFGPYGMDGLSTDRSEMASALAKWTNDPAQADLMQASNVRGEVAILYVPECSVTNYLLTCHGNEFAFANAMAGAYQGFFDNNIQADYIHIEQLNGDTKVVYFPYPVAMNKAHALALQEWVKNGGTLICEACPAYFGDHLHVGQVQPNWGMDEMFGARQQWVEFMPDINQEIAFSVNGQPVKGAGYLQTYQVNGGKACGSYHGETIAVENSYGKGKTLLLGAFLSQRYFHAHDEETRAFFAGIPEFAGVKQICAVSDNRIKTRMLCSDSETYVWVINPTEEARETTLRLNGGYQVLESLWEGGSVLDSKAIQLRIEGKNALVLRVKRL